MHRFARNRPAVVLAVAAAIAAGVAAAVPGHAITPPVPAFLSDGQASTTDFVPAVSTTDPPVQPHTQVEPSIAVNPTNPKNVVTDFQVGRVDGGGDADNGVAATTDGGATWHDQLLPGLTKDGPRAPANPFDRASDAVVAFGPDGTVYANSLVFNDNTNLGLRSGMAVNVSHDGGLTWSDPVILEEDNLGGLNDKNWIVVDQSDAPGHHKGRVFVVWDRIDPLVYAYCDANCDKLSNWSSAQTNALGQPMGFYTFYPGAGIGAMPVIQTNGVLTIVFEADFQGNPVIIHPGDNAEIDPNGSSIEQTSTLTGNGTSVFPAPLSFPQVNAVTAGTYNSVSGVPEQRAGSLPTATIDPVSNQIYVGWEDSTARPTDKRNDAVFVTSTDGGLHWTPKKSIDFNADGSYIDDYNTALSAGGDGILRAMYRQRLEPATGALSNTIDTYYQQSIDGGANWSAPLIVDRGAVTNVDYCAFSRNGCFEGDYNELATGTDGIAWIVRDEAYAPFPGAPCSCTFTDVNTRENQWTWVASVAPTTAAATNVPDARWVPSLVLLGAAVGMAAIGRRRFRHRTAA